MADSFAQTIASGTQDLAALVGLFCTDGVERNALFVQSGYFGIAVSSLSLLGVLGLVRSAVKVALGLQRCSNAGFNLDSLRGLYGYLPEESEEQKNRIECYFTEVTFGPVRDPDNVTIATPQFDHVIIRRKKRFFDPQLTPIVNVGSNWEENVHFRTVVNLGNLRREKTVPIWHGRNMSQPGAYMSVNAWNLLTLGKHKSQPDVETKPNKLSFLHARIADADFLHISGDRKLLGSERVQGLVLLPAIVCAVAYVCQYAVLTKASNRQSLIWVGCQAALALLRLLFWILDPQFDNPEVDEPPEDGPPEDGPPEDGPESLILWDIDFERLIRRHLRQSQPGQNAMFSLPNRTIKRRRKEVVRIQLGQSIIEPRVAPKDEPRN
ncbi:hypothetical protein PTMSG1_00246 [Pyrenophora teres f. maculata]|nr:hypothetical protein PTMSG1_00246 [Pyrenophora teres f. maculata]